MSRGSFMVGVSPGMGCALWRSRGSRAKPRGGVHRKPEAATMQLMSKRPPTDAADVPLDEKTRKAIREGVAQTERRDFVPDEVVTASNKRHGI
jgi:hypothetical protein